MFKMLYAFIIYHRRVAARRQRHAVAVNKRTWLWGLPEHVTYSRCMECHGLYTCRL